MKLKYPFSEETKSLFDLWKCWECGMNGVNRGGLSGHHITGRKSSSPLNCAPLCLLCHEKVTHSPEEETRYVLQTVEYLHNKGYVWKENDMNFLRDNPHFIKALNEKS